MAEPETGTAPESAGETGETLARAEAAAKREAEAETAGGRTGRSAPKVVTPKARTSRKAPARRSASTGGGVAVGPGASESSAVVRAEPPRSVTGDTIEISQSGVQVVTATNVDVRQGGIGRARATDVAVSQGGVGLARADRVSVELGGVGAAIAGEVRVTQGGVGSILARDVHVEQTAVRTLVANQVHVERTTGVLVLIARRVEGDVRTLLDWRGAIAFGAAFGVVTSLFRRRGRKG
jgi:hypothetical protein